MNKKALIGSIFSFFLFINIIVYAQENNDCKVLLESISGAYEGDCKDGLAHGKGIAQGIDNYEGKFKNGLPHGKGKYTWANGDYYEGDYKVGKKNGRGSLFTKATDKKILGYWKDDNFEKEITEPPYKVLQSTNTNGIDVQERVGGLAESIEIVFNRDGRVVSDFPDLMITSSSGSVTKSFNYTGIDNVVYPVEIIISFSSLNRMNSVSVRYDVKLQINKAGSWKIIVKY